MNEFNEVKDSGKREEFKTGSVRDTAEGKGQPHLIAGEALAKMCAYVTEDILSEEEKGYQSRIEQCLLRFAEVVDVRDANIDLIYDAMQLTCQWLAEDEDDNYSHAMKRLAKHYENGARKYSKNNWRKGQPISRYYDSAMRHLWTAMDGKQDEDHKAALLWNLVAIVQTKLDVLKGNLPKELDDFPFVKSEVWEKRE
jgi:hypothetical protein